MCIRDRVWGVEYADGTVRLFDSAAGAFID